MTNTAFVILAGLVLLQLKHFICDFLLQTIRHVRSKGIYGHSAGLEHSAIHAIGTIPCLLIVGATWTGAVAIVIVEFVIHYHEDWLKENVVKHYKWTFNDHQYWIALGADQLVHQLTYVAMIVAILEIPGALSG